MRRRSVRPPAQILTRATDHIAVAVGTTVGLFLVSDGEPDGPWFKGRQITAFLQAGNVYFVAATAPGGESIFASSDGGARWEEMKVPTGPSVAGEPSVLQFGLDGRRPPFELPRLFVGVAPACLFFSDDLCRSFELVACFHAPENPDPAVGVHTVLTHPERPHRLIVGTTQSVFRSDDDGTSWTELMAGLGRGVEAATAIRPRIHKLAMDAERPDVVWLQADDGIYRTTNGGESWDDVGWLKQAEGVSSSFGLTVVAHPDEPDTAFVFPLESPEFPCAAGGRARVYRSADGAKTWQALEAGLPLGRAYMTVEREAFAAGTTPPFPFVFGTTTGQLYASADGGDHWRLFSDNLPPVLCTRVLA